MTYLEYFVDWLIVFVGADVLGCHGYTYDTSYSELTSIPTDIPSNATIVKLNNNLIINLTSSVFSHLSQCKNIHLSSNKILLIQSGAFTGLQGLTHLDLSIKHISQTIEPTMWIGLQYLEYLDLHDNYIPSISPEAFSGLRFLKTLYLGWNYIRAINGNMWVGLQFLETVKLQHLCLREIPHHGISHMPSLAYLDLQNNLLRTLTADMFNPDIKEHPRGLNLYLSGNPLQCNSDLCWLTKAIQFGSVSVSGDRYPMPSGSYFQIRHINCTSGKRYSLCVIFHLPRMVQFAFCFR